MAVVGSGVVASDIIVHVTGAYDATLGYVQTEYTSAAPFTVDTTTYATLAHVVSVTPSVDPVTDADVGSHTFSLTIVYDTAMNTGYSPTVTFSTDVSGTLIYQASWSWWTSSTTFVVRFDVAGGAAQISSVGVTVAGDTFYDLGAIGNVQASYNGSNVFTIDITG